MPYARFVSIGLVLAAASTPACNTNESGFPSFTSDGGGATPDGRTALTNPDSGTTHLTENDASAPSASDSGSTGAAIVYGQSASVLFAVDPTTKAVTTVGSFSGCDDAVIDIALDKDSNMYATTFGGVYTIDRTTAACTLLAQGTYPNSLSFVPAGTVDPNVEALVGYNGSTYVRIDTTSGALTNVGSLGSGGYESSGDIVSVIGGSTYLTVTGGDDCSASDCLVAVNPKTGALVTNYGPLGYSQVYGLAFWAGTVYGFDSAGDLFEVTFSQSKTSVTTIPIPDAPAGLSFFGAGSTTSAPPQPSAK